MELGRWTISKDLDSLFSLTDEVVIVTGGAGLLGTEHCKAIGMAGGLPVMVDNNEATLEARKDEFSDLSLPLSAIALDLSAEDAPAKLLEELVARELAPTSLVNNVAANPPMFSGANQDSGPDSASLNFDQWNRDLALTISVASNMGMYFGDFFSRRGGGAIVNIASDLALISPDQRIYQSPGGQPPFPTKPLSYSVGKSAIIGLTRYLATYWSPIPVRCNALALGSVRGQQDNVLVENLVNRIPLGRLAEASEYQGAVVFLLGRASSYMTGSIVTIDGGRTTW